MVSDKKITFWRGTRQAFNSLNTWNPWTYYTVKEEDGHWNTFYGIQRVNDGAGQLEPVKSVYENITMLISSVEGKSKQGDRYLIGTDNTGYVVVEIGPGETLSFSEIRILGDHSVRILDRGGKEYQYYNGKLITYNDMNAGEF